MSEYEGREDYGGSRVLWGRFAFWAAMIALAFVLGRCSAGDGVSQVELDQTKAQLTEMASENRRLQNELEAVTSGGLEERAATSEAPAADDTAGGGQGAGGGDSGGQQDAGSRGGEEVQGQRYTVQPGDTINSITQQFYGNLTHAQLIIEANAIEDVDQLKAGQELVIPPAPSG